MTFETFAFLGVMYGVILSLGPRFDIDRHRDDATARAAGTTSSSGSTVRGWSCSSCSNLHVWWSLWNLQQAVAEWNFVMFLVLLLGPSALFLSTQVLLFEPGSATDTREHYFSVHRVFFALLALVVVWELAAAPLFFGTRDPLAGLQLVVLAIFAALATTKKPTVHAALAVVSWVIFVGSIVGHGAGLAL